MTVKFIELCLYLSLWILYVSADQVIYGGDESVEEGEAFNIICVTDDDENVEGEAFDIFWAKDGEHVIDDEDYSIENYKTKDGIVSVLSVRRALEEHEGSYKCDFSSEDSHYLHIDDEEQDEEDGDDSFTEILSDDEKQPLYLHCDIPTDEDVEIKWLKDGIEIEDDDYILKDDYLIKIKPSKEDSGQYVCQIKSSEDQKKYMYIGRVFEIESSPGIHPFPPSVNFVNGKDLKLECLVFGYPEPKIHWFIGEKDDAIKVNPKVGDRVMTYPNSKYENANLYISNINYDDENLYMCQAENVYGVKEESVYVTILENMIKTNDNSGKGIILIPKKELILQCETIDCENCTVEWYKDGDHINKSDSRIHINNSNNTLSISAAKEKDTGDYMCIVDKKIIGELINATITVRTKTEVEQFDKSINKVQGDKLVLHCVIKTGSPQPSVIWLKDGQPINDSNNHIKLNDDENGIVNAILTIEELEYSDRAEYTCKADNGISSDNTTILVRVKDKLAALWPFLGICAEVGILCTIIFVYERKKAKEIEESDTDKVTESKNVPGRGRSQDVRQRK